MHLFEMLSEKVSDLLTSQVIFTNLQSAHLLKLLQNFTVEGS